LVRLFEIFAFRANVNLADNDGWMPLHFAARYGNAEMVDTLLGAGAGDSVNLPLEDSWTPLHQAVRYGDAKRVNALIGAGAGDSVNKPDKKKSWTPLHYAARYNNLEVVEALLKAGGSVNLRTKHGVTPLFLAWSNPKQMPEIFKLIEAQIKFERARSGYDAKTKDLPPIPGVVNLIQLYVHTKSKSSMKLFSRGEKHAEIDFANKVLKEIGTLKDLKEIDTYLESVELPDDANLRMLFKYCRENIIEPELEKGAEQVARREEVLGGGHKK